MFIVPPFGVLDIGGLILKGIRFPSVPFICSKSFSCIGSVQDTGKHCTTLIVTKRIMPHLKAVLSSFHLGFPVNELADGNTTSMIDPFNSETIGSEHCSHNYSIAHIY